MTTTCVAGVMEAADAYPKAKAIPYTQKCRRVVCSLSPFAKASGVMLAFGVLTVLAGRAQEDDRAGQAFVAVSRSEQETLWQRVEWQVDQRGQAVARTNDFVEVATGLNYLLDESSTEWQPSREEWEVYPKAIVARAGQHKVILAHNLNLAGAVDVLTPDGMRLISSPVSLGFYDPVDGKQVVIAEVMDCAAERGAARNEIVFRNCFDRIRGSIRYLYTKAGVHQHVVLEQKLELPEGFSDKSRLECYTVFDAGTPWPEVRTRVLRREKDPLLQAQMVEPDFTDSELSFGNAMAMRAGKAFSLGDEKEVRSIRVGKQFMEINGMPVLHANQCTGRTIDNDLAPEQLLAYEPCSKCRKARLLD